LSQTFASSKEVRDHILITLTSFWDINGTAHVKYLLTGTTIKHEHNVGMMKKTEGLYKTPSSHMADIT
jgi:hypothetical protein